MLTRIERNKIMPKDIKILDSRVYLFDTWCSFHAISFVGNTIYRISIGRTEALEEHRHKREQQTEQPG